MPFSFSCGDVIPGCAARFEADSEDGIFSQVGTHAAADHGITDVTPEIAGQVKAHIVQS